MKTPTAQPRTIDAPRIFAAAALAAVLAAAAVALPLIPVAAETPTAENPAATARFTSDAWHDLTRADGSGMYFDLIRRVFAGAGVQVEFEVLPYARAVSAVKAGKADGWVASFLDEQDFPVYPLWHFDRNRQVAVSCPSKVPSLGARAEARPAALEGKRVLWLRNFNLDKYLPVKVDFEEVDRVENALLMLKAGRADYFLGAESDVASALGTAGVDRADYRVEFLMHLKLYMAFRDDEKGRFLRDVWDERMRTLRSDPAFLAIYARYGYPAPFD